MYHFLKENERVGAEWTSATNSRYVNTQLTDILTSTVCQCPPKAPCVWVHVWGNYVMVQTTHRVSAPT